jgi:hypothetical protein
MHEVIMIAFISAGVLLAFLFKEQFSATILKILPYCTGAILMAVAVAVSEQFLGLSSSQNLFALSGNIIEVVRNSFLATVGVVLLYEYDPAQDYVRFRSLDGRILDWDSARLNVLLTLVCTIYTVLVFQLLAPQVFDIRSNVAGRNLATLFLAILAAVNEELLFRLFVIPLFVFLGKKWEHRWLIGVAASSALWASTHSIAAGLDWVRYIQVFPLGLVLGYTFKKRGFLSCVIIHVSSNILIWISSAFL